jgi:hypothetical protein
MMLMMMHTKTVLAVKEHDRTPSSSESSSRRDSNEAEEYVQCASACKNMGEIKTWAPWLGAPAASGASACLSTTFMAGVLKNSKSKPSRQVSCA